MSKAVEELRKALSHPYLESYVEQREAIIRNCAAVARERYPKWGAHTYASENADRYLAMEEAAEVIAELIESVLEGDDGA